VTTDTQPTRLLRLPDVERLTSLKRSAIYARVARNEFPQPLALSTRATCWREDEVIAWMNALPRGVGPRPGTSVAA
jgi:prophage regulatory protein